MSRKRHSAEKIVNKLWQERGSGDPNRQCPRGTVGEPVILSSEDRVSLRRSRAVIF